ncbi:MAG: hypothetical protein JSW25_03530 [Thermoplasmata archaeon]|nr:MAG: hypothetical protein JSW25_03530 [Thermoplasmata archaeon]
MAKGSGKGKKGGASKKGDKPKRDDKPKKEAQKRSRFSPIKTQVHESGIKEVSALRAFLTSFVFFSLILAPVLGLGLYFAWDMFTDLLETEEVAFMVGMAGGILISFVIAVLFTRKAVAST